MITDVQKYLSQFYQGTKNPNLETMKYFTKKLNHPENEYKIIHIAGTNGKGSVTEMVCRVLIEQGYTVGKYMSPHLIKFNERICVNNVQISDEEKISYNKIYVYNGDTLWSIAEEQKESNSYYKSKDVRYIIYDIKNINHMEDSNVFEGQELYIPYISNIW